MLPIGSALSTAAPSSESPKGLDRDHVDLDDDFPDAGIISVSLSAPSFRHRH